MNDSNTRSKRKPTRIFLCGAHSVGKSTLAEAITKQTGFHLVTEVARTVIRNSGLKREDYEPRSNPDGFKKLQHLIITSQSEIESSHDELEHDYVCDRAIDPVVYTLVYLGEKDAKELLQQESTKQNIKRYQSSMVFVIKPFPECMSEDSVRLRPKMEELILFTSTLETLLCDLQIPYTLIDVLELEERIRIVQEQVQKQTSSPANISTSEK